MTKDEALRLALEALEELQNAIYNIGGEHVIDLNFAIEQADVSEFAITAIKAALEAKDEPVAHSVVAGALFDFMGWLTSREKRLILSSVDEASPAVEAITEFAKKRNLSLKYAEVGYWMEFLSTPPQQEAKDEPVAWWIPKHKAPDMVSKVRWSDECEPLYTTPPQRKPLSKAEAAITAYRGYDEYWTEDCNGSETEAWIACARAIEAAHGIKGEV